VQAQSPRLKYSAIATSDDFPISGNIFKEASAFNINSRSAAAFRGDTEYFTIRFSQFLQMIDQVTPHCPKAFFDQLNIADATKVTPVPQLFFALPNDA